VEAQIRRKGYYPLQMSLRGWRARQGRKVRAETFQPVMLEESTAGWAWLTTSCEGRVRCFVCPGNDDEMEVDDVIRRPTWSSSARAEWWRSTAGR
jgi:Icc-related predicted phosphoesterase